MHQYTHPHAFTPILHQSSAGIPAPAMTGAQDSHVIQHLVRGTTRLRSFTPVTAIHRVTQKSFKSTKRGRWSAQHVCIAWRIYYHKQLKKMQPKPNSLHQEETTSLPEEPDHHSSIQPYLDSTCGQSAYVERSETRKPTENSSNLKRSHSSGLHTSSTPSCNVHTTKREILGQHPNLSWKEKMDKKEEHRHHQLQEHSWDHTVVTPELVGRHATVSHDRKRPLETGSFNKVKRVKQEVVEDRFEPPSLSTACTDLSSHTTPLQHTDLSDTSALYCYSSGYYVARTPTGVVSYPRAEMYAYQNASWEQMGNEVKTMNQSLRQQLVGDNLLNGCKMIRIPHEAQKHKEVFHGSSAPHLHFPLAMRQQETAYLTGRKFINSVNESHHLQHYRHHHCHCATMSHLLHPGFLAASYTGC